MSVPGSNLLKAALTVIAPSTVTYYRNTGRGPNAAGQLVAILALVGPVQGSVQPVPRSKYEALGLDLSKDYFNLYTSSPVIDLQRDVSGDQFDFNGNKYQCQSKTAWEAIDGWCSVLAIRIPS